MKNQLLVLCLVIVLTSWLSEAKPQGCTNCGSNHREITDRCCKDCELCRVSFNVEKPVDPECPRPKNYSYNVVHINPHCQVEPCETWSALVEKPKAPACPKKLKLSAIVEHHVRDCDCPICWYGNSSKLIPNQITNIEHDCTNKSIHHNLKPKKLFEFCSDANKVGEEFVFDRKRQKRSLLHSKEIGCEDLVKLGYICRCMPDDGKSCSNKSRDGEPIVGSIFSPPSNEPEVYIGGGEPPSYNIIRQHITPILVANEGRSAIQEAKELAEIYYEIYRRHHEKNLTMPIKYGTKTIETEESGLRTYDIEPIQGKFEPSTHDIINRFGNHIFRDFIDRVRQGPRLGLFPLRSLGQSKRSQRNSKRKLRHIKDLV